MTASTRVAIRTTVARLRASRTSRRTAAGTASPVAVRLGVRPPIVVLGPTRATARPSRGERGLGSPSGRRRFQLRLPLRAMNAPSLWNREDSVGPSQIESARREFDDILEGFRITRSCRRTSAVPTLNLVLKTVCGRRPGILGCLMAALARLLQANGIVRRMLDTATRKRGDFDDGCLPTTVQRIVPDRGSGPGGRGATGGSRFEFLRPCQAMTASSTLPWTSVRRKSRPA